MVSFFGLKFGADKKKKEVEGKKAPQEWKKIDQNTMGEGQFFGRDIHRKGVVNGSIRSVSRPGTAHSNRGASPYAMQTHNFAASSMYDLSNLDRGRKGSFGSLKPFASDANLRMRFNNASSSSLAAPPLPMPTYGSRPGTPNSTRTKAWVNPLDVHFSRPTTPALPQTPKSPLGQFEFGVSEKAETSSLFGDSPEKVAEEISARVALDQERARAKSEAEARARAQAELEAQAKKHIEAASPLTSPPTSPPMSIPSPPASMKREPGPIIIGPGPAPRFQGPAANDERPPSRGRDRQNGAPGPRGPGSRPRDPRDREPRGGPKHHAGPHGLPSPPLSQGTRFSEEKASRPIIQNVRAKRDTLTISGPKRKSLEMEIDEFEKSLMKAQGGRKASSSSSHYSEGMDDRTLGEPMLPPLAPPPLQEQQQRKPSPSFAQPQRTQSPMGRALPVRGPNAPRRPDPAEYGASFRRAESPMGPGPSGRPPRPAPEEYGVPIHGRPESPMGRPPMARAARPESPMGRPTMNGPQRTQSPRGRAPMAKEPRPQSPMGRPPQMNHGPRAESPMGRPRMNPGPRPESPMGRPQMPAGRRPESPMGRPRMNPGPRPESPMGRPPQMNPGPRPESPMGRPPQMNHARRPESPMGRPPMNRPTRPESPMGHPQMNMGRRPESPMGRPQYPAARRPESPMGHPRINNGPRPESPAPARNSPRAADFQSENSHPRGRKNSPPEFRQPNWNPTPQAELRREDFSAPQAQVVVAAPAPARDDPNWPLPSPVVASSPPTTPVRPKRGPPPPINIAATLYADDMGRGPFTPPAGGGGGHRLMSPVEDRRPHTGGLPGTEDGIGMARGLSVRGDTTRDNDYHSGRPNYGLRSPTGIADEYGTGFI